MAGTEEDKEKAEKVAAARKRYEQLKKQKAKKAAKAEDEDNSVTNAAAAATNSKKTEQESVEQEVKPEQDAEDVGDGANDTVAVTPVSRDKAGKQGEESHTESTKVEDVQKRFARLQEMYAERGETVKRLESELDELRDIQGDIVALKIRAADADEKAKEVEKLKGELAALQRQRSYVARRKSSATAATTEGDSKAQIAAQTSTIESLELEVSNLRHSLSISESQQAELNARITSLEGQLQMAEQSTVDSRRELEDLRQLNQQSMADAGTTINSSNSGQDPEAQIKDLQTALSAAQRSATEAGTRSTQLEKKIDALLALHRELEIRNQTQAQTRSKELERLRNEANEMRKRLGSVSNENARLRDQRSQRNTSALDDDSEENEDGEQSDEKRALQSRVRELESEVFDLKRGVWQERRRELQPPGDDGEETSVGTGGVFDDIDLDTPSASTHRPSFTSPYGAFSNMLNAFTGNNTAGSGGGAQHHQQQHQQQQHHQQRQGASNGFTDDDDGDFDFDEDAFKTAQQDEEKKRLERVREVKRGLKDFSDFRVDLVDLRGGAMAGVFDI